jgi:hypothetical protein
MYKNKYRKVHYEHRKQIAIGGNEDEKVYEKRIQKKPLCDMSIKEIHATSQVASQ